MIFWFHKFFDLQKYDQHKYKDKRLVGFKLQYIPEAHINNYVTTYYVDSVLPVNS